MDTSKKQQNEIVYFHLMTLTNFHEKEDGIIQFCHRPHKRGVIAL